MEEYNQEKSVRAQAEYLSENEIPHFPPRDGICWSCNSNIYEEQTREVNGKTYSTGIPLEQAKTELITGCPHCNRSYVS